MFGKKGNAGSNGQPGGAGGKGSLGGMIFLYGFEDSSKVRTYNYCGRNGEPGRGGKGGQGGKNAPNYRLKFEKRNSYWLPLSIDTDYRGWSVINTNYNGMASSGLDSNEISYHDIKLPEVAPTENILDAVNDFKLFLLSNINNNIAQDELIKFYFFLENNTNIRSIYDSMDFLNDLYALENQYFNLQNIELDAFYESLLRRINQYAREPKAYEKTNGYKKVLNYLYAATLSRIVSMKQQIIMSNCDMIIDIDSYFSAMMNNLKRLQIHENEIIKNVFNINYKKRIELKINEENDFFENQIVPDIETSLSMIDQKIEKLINEIIELESIENMEISNQVHKHRELVETMEKREIMSIFKFINIVLKSLFPIGRTVTGLIQSTNKVSDALSLEEDEFASSFPKGINCLIDKEINIMQNILQNKTIALEYYLNKFSEKINQHPKELNDLISMVNTIKSNLTNPDQNEDLDFLKLISLIEQIINGLNKKVVASVDNSNSPITSLLLEQASPEIFRIINIFRSTVHVAGLFSDVYVRYKDDEVKLEKINYATCQEGKNIESIHKYQINVYNTLFPMFRIIQNDILTYTHGSSTRSLVALDVARWQVQDTCRNLQVLLGKFTQEFKMDDELKSSVDKLDKVMGTLINIYDRIQEYNEQKELADYIGNINSVRSNNIKIQNETLNHAITKLEYTMKSNIVLGQFGKAIDSFKQFIFPFVRFYLEEFDLPPHTEMKNSVEHLISTTNRKIKELKSKLTKTNLLLRKNADQYVSEEYFQGGEQFTGPFYIWEKDKHANTIYKLLSGKEIILKADILYSIHNKNAIKFNRIGINFKSREKSINKLLERLNSCDITMKHFGNSFFRCNNNFYLLHSDSQTFDYSFQKDEYGEPVRKNKVYSKIKTGQYLLSPYATWSFQLKNNSKLDFSMLSNLHGKVDLELTGYGQYVSEKSDVCRNLQHYYNTATFTVTDGIDGSVDNVV